MKSTPSLAVLLESFFTMRLMKQRQASPHTIGSYRDTFRLLLQFIQKRLRKPPSRLALEEIDAPLIAAFLEEMEKSRGISPRSRNLRLTAIRSFFQYAALEAPAQSAQIQRVLAIPGKRHTHSSGPLPHATGSRRAARRTRSTHMVRPPRPCFPFGCRANRLRVSEMTGLQQDLSLATGAHIRVVGKGRKERCTPLTKQTVAVLKAWLREPARGDTQTLFPNARGGRLSADGVQFILAKHTAVPANAARRWGRSGLHRMYFATRRQWSCCKLAWIDR